MRRARSCAGCSPSWHERERAFRDWYGPRPSGRLPADGRQRRAAEEALRLPETVTGFREVRYPKEDAARAASPSSWEGR